MRGHLRSAWFWGLAPALLAGAGFRLVWLEDMEYKSDEAWVHQLVCDFLHEGRVAWLGMPSSQNVRIPGLSIWQFYPLGALFGVDEPTGLARGVQVVNVLALVALLAFAWRAVPAQEREWWLWAVALVCINPVVVLFQRKIWPPSVLPLGLVALVVCWWHRQRRWGAFGWGAVAALLFGIHVAMLFHAAALTAWTWLGDRRRVAWRWWLAGSLAGALPALPWVWYMLTTPDQAGREAVRLTRLIELKYWSHWITEPLGVGLSYALGPDTQDLLAGPRIGGFPTYGIALVQVATVCLGLWLVARALIRWWKERPTVGQWLGAGARQTDLVLHAMFWGFGLVLTATCLRFYRHYLLLAFPFPMLWLARQALPPGASAGQLARGRAALLAVCAAGAVLTGSTLWWLHEHGGSERGGYGSSYAARLARGTMPWIPPQAAE